MATTSSPAQSGWPLWRWIDERLGLSALTYEVPAGANSLPYMLGVISLVGFLVLLATGIYLAQYYHPHPSDAHNSVAYLITRTSAGGFVRSLHFWMANLVAVTVLLHFLRVFATASFRWPRELNWVLGVGLLATTLGFFFSGMVLKWDQEGVEALGHNEEIGRLLGGFGGWFTSEFTPSVPILTRLYFAHVSLLPAVFTLLIIGHLALVKRHGISKPVWAEPGGRPESFARHLRRAVGYGLLLTAAGGVLALVVPQALQPLIDPSRELTKPLWPFLSLYPLEDWIGIKALLFTPIALFGLLLLVPFLDLWWPFPRLPFRPLAVAGAVALLAAAVAFGIFAQVSPVARHIMNGG